jgi:hypothetical protein
MWKQLVNKGRVAIRDAVSSNEVSDAAKASAARLKESSAAAMKKGMNSKGGDAVKAAAARFKKTSASAVKGFSEKVKAQSSNALERTKEQLKQSTTSTLSKGKDALSGTSSFARGNLNRFTENASKQLTEKAENASKHLSEKADRMKSTASEIAEKKGAELGARGGAFRSASERISENAARATTKALGDHVSTASQTVKEEVRQGWKKGIRWFWIWSMTAIFVYGLSSSIVKEFFKYQLEMNRRDNIAEVEKAKGKGKDATSKEKEESERVTASKRISNGDDALIGKESYNFDDAEGFGLRKRLSSISSRFTGRGGARGENGEKTVEHSIPSSSSSNSSNDDGSWQGMVFGSSRREEILEEKKWQEKYFWAHVPSCISGKKDIVIEKEGSSNRGWGW